MAFATNHRPEGRVALLVSKQTLDRITPGLVPFVGPERGYDDIVQGEAAPRILERLRELDPVGVIMEFDPEVTELVASLGRPVVLVMADMLMDGVGSVNVDDYAVGKLAAQDLKEKGFNRFLYFGREIPHAPERQHGFVETLGAGGHEVTLLEVADALRERAQAGGRLEKLLLRPGGPTGVFAGHDPFARVALEAARRLGLKVPAEVGILSASNDPATCELVYPGISSVEIPWEEVGRAAGSMLEGMLSGRQGPFEALIAPKGIRTRQSTDDYRVSDERVQRALGFMEVHFQEDDWSIASLVQALGLDRRALERLFRQHLKRSPKAVLTEMRLRRARELMEQERYRIGEVAERSGFGTSGKLAQAFGKRFGCSPREWRKRRSGLPSRV